MNVCMMDCDTPTYSTWSTNEYSANHKYAKKNISPDLIVTKKIRFTPLVFRVDRSIGMKIESFIKGQEKYLDKKLNHLFLCN